jgi:hypothetical protein
MKKLFQFNLRPNGKRIKISPTRLFALFTYLLHASDAEVEKLEAHVESWSEPKEKQKLWTRGTTNEEREAYFNMIYAQFI